MNPLSLLGGPWGLVAALVGALAIFGAGSYTGYRLEYGALEAQKLADANSLILAQKLASDRQKASDAITMDSAVKSAQAHERIVTNTQTIVEKVPVYVTKKQDAACILPNSVIRLLDAAGSQTSLDTLPGSSSEPNDAPSGISLSKATSLLANNLGRCAGNSQQLKSLEDWIEKQEALPQR